MPTINEALLPTISPGTLLARFTTDESINIRWLTATDPVYFEVLNRPMADIALRQLILAKTLDNLNLRLGHQALFPFLVQPRIIDGSFSTDLPLSWIWDMHVSVPQKWDRLRLAKIKRVAGINQPSGSQGPLYTGTLRLVFTAIQTGSATEVAVFQVDYEIDSTLTYQIARVTHLKVGDEPIVLPAGEIETIDGYVTFRTLDEADPAVAALFNAVPPPVGSPIVGGEYVPPSSFPIADSEPANMAQVSFDQLAVSHGTGLLTLSAWTTIPAINSDIATWINVFNYPWDAEANLQSATIPGVAIPRGLFKELNLTAPAGDGPLSDTSGLFYPVYVSRISRNNNAGTSITFFFATYNAEAPSIVPIEFGQLTLQSTFVPDQIIPIVQGHHLFPTRDTDPNFFQGFGRGHVKLSDLWGTTTVTDFFAAFVPIVNDPPEALFVQQSTRVSSYALSRVPQYTPTIGQAQALRGSQDGITFPSSTNRYVVETDQGIGTQIDFATNPALATDKRENPDIERYGFTGALIHKVFSLIVDASGVDHDYPNDLLPRIRILLERDPAFGDFWWDGTRLKFFNGDTWVG